MVVESSVFAPHVQKQIEAIMKSEPIGLCEKRIVFMNPRPSCPDYLEDAKSDQVKLIIPFGGVPVECWFMFQADQPSCPPDFIFSDSRFVVPFDKITVLHNWSSHKSFGLMKLVKQLMYHFKVKHLSLLEHHYYIHQEYLSVISTGKYLKEDIEVFVPSNKHIPISISLRLKPDFSNMPAAYFKYTDSKNFPVLLITFQSNDKNKRTLKLYFSTELEAAIGLVTSFKLPSYHSNMTLAHYTQILENDITKKADIVISGYQLRKKYMATFLSNIEYCVVEYDCSLFRKLSFLVEERGYHFIVEVNIPPIYPITMPILTFRSLYHAYDGIPTSVLMNAYPFSPDWSFDHIYQETMKYVNEYAQLFPKDSVPFQ